MKKNKGILYFLLVVLGAIIFFTSHTQPSPPPIHSVITPNGKSLPWVMDHGVKVFHLIAEPIQREFAPHFWVNCWGYNGSSPGPTIEAFEGDKVRIFVTNNLPEATSVHWHGIIVPNGMDGVVGLNQSPIQPGETFKYEFTLQQSGTFMYHPHADEATQISLGMMGFFIIHPQREEEPKVQHDFAIFLHEWKIPIGARTPNPFEMVDFNLFTFNSSLYPTTEALHVKTNDRVRIRFANLMMDSHPIHLHGHEFTLTRMGGNKLSPLQQVTMNTISVEPGETRDIEFQASNPGDWALHCHKAHHTMNQMTHDLPNCLGIPTEDLNHRISTFFPDFMGIMNTNGTIDMFEGHHEMNSFDNIAPIGNPGPFGTIEMGGMFTILKVRDSADQSSEWYTQPEGTSAKAVFIDEVPECLR